MGQEFPSDYGLQTYYSCDVLPAYPDNAAGTTYLQDAWATVDGWAAINAKTVVSTDAGRLKLVFDGTDATGAGTYHAKSTWSGKLCRIKITSANPITSVAYYDGSNYVQAVYTLLDQYTAYANFVPTISAGYGYLAIKVNPEAVANTVYFDWIYIGSGLYDTLLSDDSGNGNSLTVHSSCPTVGIHNNGLYRNGIDCYESEVSTLAAVPDIWHYEEEYIGTKLATEQAFINYKANSPSIGWFIFYRAASSDSLVLNYASGSSALAISFANYFTGFTFLRCRIAIEINWITGVVKVWRNGVYFGTATMATPVKPIAGSYIYYGSYKGTLYYAFGVFDERRLYSRELTDAEVLSLYTNIVRPTYSAISPNVESQSSQASVFIVDSTSSGFNLTSTIDNYENLMFEQSFASIGKFSFSMMADGPQAKYVKVNSFVVVSSSYGQAQNRIGIILSVDRAINQDHKKVLTVSGFEAKGMFSWRIIVPPDDNPYWQLGASYPAETIFKSIIDQHGGASTLDSFRKFTGLSIASDLGRGTSYYVSERYTNAAAVMERLAYASKIGWRISWSGSGLIFDVIEGKDRTLGNGTYTPAVLSTDFDTVTESHLVSDETSYKTFCYVGGQGVGVSRVITAAYLGPAFPSNLNRKELFNDARELDTVNKLGARGNEILAATAYTSFVSAIVNPYSFFVKSSGASLGDYVTVQSFGYEMTSQIMGITEQWGANGYQIEYALDKKPATLASVIGSTSNNLARLSTGMEV